MYTGYKRVVMDHLLIVLILVVAGVGSTMPTQRHRRLPQDDLVLETADGRGRAPVFFGVPVSQVERGLQSSRPPHHNLWPR